MRRSNLRADDGQTLIFALAFLVFITAIVVGMLNLALANVRTTKIVKDNRSTNYDADGAMEIAIASVRANTHQGFLGTCLSRADTGVTLTGGSKNFVDAQAAAGDVGSAVSDSAGRIPAGTTVASISGSTVTMSNAASGSASNDTVTFSLLPTYGANNPVQQLRVDCFPTLAPFFQRHVVLEVCRSADSSPCDIAGKSLIRAEVTFYDDQSYGRAVVINSWSTR